jgi:4-hydroxy-tetrahydrodipicolinate synthase
MADLKGVYPPIPTPFRPGSLEVDLDLFEAHLRWLRGEGVDGILVLGTNGEFPSLSFAERQKIARFALEKRGSLEILVNVSATNFPEVLELGRVAAEAGARAVLVMPPYYYRNASLSGFLDFYQRVLDTIRVPVLLYHFPAFSGVELGREGIARLAEHPNFAGVKDSGGKIDSILGFLEHPRLRVFAGNDHLAEEAVSRGAAGVITSCSNVLPGLVRHVVGKAARAGEPDLLQKTLSRGRLIVEKYGGIPAVKALLEARGIGRALVRPPLVALGEEARRKLREEFDAFLASAQESTSGRSETTGRN